MSQNDKNIEGIVRETIGELTGIKKDKIILSQDLRKDLGIDSFAAMELIYHVEDKFNISISSDELLNIKSVNDIISGVKSKLEKSKKGHSDE
jgi:acyl carrier protein